MGRALSWSSKFMWNVTTMIVSLIYMCMYFIKWQWVVCCVQLWSVYASNTIKASTACLRSPGSQHDSASWRLACYSIHSTDCIFCSDVTLILYSDEYAVQEDDNKQLMTSLVYLVFQWAYIDLSDHWSTVATSVDWVTSGSKDNENWPVWDIQQMRLLSGKRLLVSLSSNIHIIRHHDLDSNCNVSWCVTVASMKHLACNLELNAVTDVNSIKIHQCIDDAVWTVSNCYLAFVSVFYGIIVNDRMLSDIISFAWHGAHTCCWSEYFQCALQAELYVTLVEFGLSWTWPSHCTPSVLCHTGLYQLPVLKPFQFNFRISVNEVWIYLDVCFIHFKLHH